MEIKELSLFTDRIDEQEHFYKNVLGFNCSRVSKKSLEVSTRWNKLILNQSSKGFCYHFAFLIAPQSLQSAIAYLEDRSIELLTYKDGKIVHFNTGRAIYFYDMDGNIVEFIERPTLGFAPSTRFSVKDVLKINEIGLSVEEPLQMAERLVNEFQIDVLNEKEFKDTFCWVGDYNGVIIVVKEGRHWLPTKKPAVRNDFSIEYIANESVRSITFKNNNIV